MTAERTTVNTIFSGGGLKLQDDETSLVPLSKSKEFDEVHIHFGFAVIELISNVQVASVVYNSHVPSSA